MSARQSLFDAGTAPVLEPASQWLAGTLLGEVAVSLCVIAVAFVGFAMLTGRLAARDGLRVGIGCFVLLGAPALAAGLREAAGDAAGHAPADISAFSPSVEQAPLPPTYSDPYAGASLRRD